MRSTISRLCLAAGTVAVLLFAAACSQMSGSGSLSPTGPSLGVGSTAVIVEPPDPCEPSGFTTVVEEPDLCGRFTGGGFQINANDVKVTRGFTLHCDARLSNNFEVNWKDANGNAHHFHIEKNPPVVECSLVGIPPNPPDAGVNRIVILAAPGALDGVSGHTATIVLEDHGESGKDDRAYIAIDGTGIVNGSVASPSLIDGGNIQAHFDQPHKNK